MRSETRRRRGGCGRWSVVVLCGWVLTCSPAPSPSPRQCNGMAELCERRLNEVSFLRTHNSHSSEEAGFYPVAQNHLKNIRTQLEDGVRSLNVDVYFEGGELLVCHGTCAFGSSKYVDVLLEIKGFLERNPNEVVLLDLQNEAGAERVLEVTAESGVVDLLHVQAPGTPWPSLGEMIDQGRRLVLFTNQYVDGPQWYHAVGDFIFGTHWHAEYPEELTCELTREPLVHGLFELSHTLTRPWARIGVSEEVNYNPFLQDRIEACRAAVGRKPNLLSIDFYTHSDGLTAVDRLNREE